MLILLRDTDLDGHPIIGSGILLTGTSALEIVQKMQATSPFNAGDVTDYMKRILEATGEEAPLPEREVAAAAQAFLQRLAGRGLVEFKGEGPPKAAQSDTIPQETVAPAQLNEALTIIRDSGLTNMLDHPEVARLAHKFGFAEVADWIASHPTAYTRHLLKGAFRPLEDNFAGKGDEPCADKQD